ncbi:hypothetical protein SD70_00035 [Gordoniibacillus kamchatkensis]|uniref:Uncharacterized protein n=1 Tax=Gordoniibacillus kamchatkensis TaxID=1590651 RepID=A0ABR5AMX9_9BACL|nr:hypothetical protein [Paenibacillus sp. VKM B-2647]KIL42376.1 hypothetical protein SD70_00035 [Paenibacillus sp. VKM B-2647]
MNWNFIICNVLDLVQWFAMLTLSLTLFRLKPAGWWRHNALLSVALKTVTLALTATPLHSHLSIVQLVLITLAFYWFYRIRFDYACVIAVTGGIIVFISVLAVNYALALAGGQRLADVMFNKLGLPLYFASAALLTSWIVLLAWMLKRFRLGFSFVSTSYRQTKPGRRLFGIPLTMFLAITIMLPPSEKLTNLPLLVAGICVCLLMLLLASLRTELADDAGTRFGPKTGD